MYPRPPTLAGTVDPEKPKHIATRVVSFVCRQEGVLGGWFLFGLGYLVAAGLLPRFLGRVGSNGAHVGVVRAGNPIRVNDVTTGAVPGLNLTAIEDGSPSTGREERDGREGKSRTKEEKKRKSKTRLGIEKRRGVQIKTTIPPTSTARALAVPRSQSTQEVLAP